MPEPWALASRQFSRPPAALRMVTTMTEEVVEAQTTALPPVEGVLGIGGGSCMDFAKYVAWQRNLPLLLAPSIVSVDACLTEAVAVRRDGRVHYMGEAYPREVVVDFDLVCAAPPELNRAGAGDILSIHTALCDWHLAHELNGEPYDIALAAESRALLDRLAEKADDVRNATPEGIRALVELFWAEVRLCQRAGSSRPEEGSEHFWAYNLEFLTRRSFLHGDLIALGILLMSGLQENDVSGARERIEAVGLRHTPEALGLSREAVRESLLTARDYAVSDQLNFSILNVREMTPKLADRLIDGAQ
jgi:glycerol dehydrogenase-like iron-containing ADH family enzyme